MVDILAIWKISVLVAVVLVVVVVVFVAVVIVGAFVGSREKRSEGICPAAPTIFPPSAATGATC